MAKKCIKDITFEQFSEWCNNRACDGAWSMGSAMTCIEVIDEVMKVKPLFGRKKAREEKWKSIRGEYLNLDFEIDL